MVRVRILLTFAALLGLAPVVAGCGGSDDPAASATPTPAAEVAGSGADAAPYFRVFNPELQREKFDPHGDYVRRWVPEWDTDAYPEPIVDLKESRQAALAAYETVKASR